MENESSPIEQDVTNLKETASDAVSDLKDKATKHAKKAGDQLQDLASHVQEEGQDKLEDVKGSFNDILEASSSYVAARPLACVGAAFLVGVFIGAARSR